LINRIILNPISGVPVEGEASLSSTLKTRRSDITNYSVSRHIENNESQEADKKGNDEEITPMHEIEIAV
jgi:hypothetical protein